MLRIVIVFVTTGVGIEHNYLLWPGADGDPPAWIGFMWIDFGPKDPFQSSPF